MFKNLFQSENPKATVREGMLVLSLTNAMSPVVWRLDMRKVTASALEVRQTKDGLYDLVLKTQKSDVNHIASFEEKPDALKALKVVMQAIESAPNNDLHAPNVNITTNEHKDPSPNGMPDIPQTISSKNRPVMAGAIGAGVVVLLLIFFGWIGGSLQSGQTSASLMASQGSAAETTGKPVSADDFLKARGN